VLNVSQNNKQRALLLRSSWYYLSATRNCVDLVGVVTTLRAGRFRFQIPTGSRDFFLRNFLSGWWGQL